MPRVIFERDGRIARITVNRPDEEVPLEVDTAFGVT